MQVVLEKFRPVLATLEMHRASRGAFTQLQHIREPGALADAIAAQLSAEIDQKQDLLETGDMVRRLEKIVALMKTERQSA